MSDAEKELLLDAIHKQLDNAISYNLWSGLVYGTYRHFGLLARLIM